jgi:multimeric flavodoxin WrbA
MIKVVAFNGSARAEGNTADLLARATGALEQASVTTETISLAAETFRGCIGCYLCFENKNRRCAVESDGFNDCMTKMVLADGVLIGSPVYFADCSAITKALIERAGMVARANSNMLARKVGAAVAAVRRAGAIHTLDSIQHFFTISEMIIVGSSYWNLGQGRKPHQVLEDQEGLETMDTLGANMAWLLGKLAG